MSGLRRVDVPAKRIAIGFSALQLASSRSRVPTPDSSIEFDQIRPYSRIKYRLLTPCGWREKSTMTTGCCPKRNRATQVKTATST